MKYHERYNLYRAADAIRDRLYPEWPSGKPDWEGHKASKDGYYHYIPLTTGQFVDLMLTTQDLHISLGQWGTRHFVDVGCGIGDKCALAKLMFGMRSTGVEYVEHTSTLAQERLRQYDIKIHQLDAFKHSFKDYSLIYMYRPIADIVLYEKLYRHIVKTAAIGTIIVEALPHYATNKQWVSLFERGPQEHFPCYTGRHPYSNGLCVKTTNGLRRYNFNRSDP